MTDNRVGQGSGVRKARRVRAVTGVIVASTLLFNTACYTYLPAPGGAPVSGSDVQIELTADGSAVMQAAVGPRIRIIEGRVRAIDAAGNPTIDVEQLTSFDGLVVPYAGRDPVLVARTNIRYADVRTLNRRKSWVAAGVVGGIFVTAVVTALIKARSKATGDPGRIGGAPPDIKAP